VLYLAARRETDRRDLARDLPWSALAAHVVEVAEAELLVLSALHAEVRVLAAVVRQDQHVRAPEGLVGVLQRLEVGGRVAVDRVAVGVAAAVGVERDDGVAPVERPGGEGAVARAGVDAVRERVERDAGLGPDARLLARAVGRAAEVDRLVAAHG